MQVRDDLIEHLGYKSRTEAEQALVAIDRRYRDAIDAESANGCDPCTLDRIWRDWIAEARPIEVAFGVY